MLLTSNEDLYLQSQMAVIISLSDIYIPKKNPQKNTFYFLTYFFLI